MKIVKNNRVINGSSAIKFIYIFVYIFLSALFLKILYTQIVNTFFEQDLLWFIPTIVRETEGLSFIQLISYFLNPFPLWWGIPLLKIYALFILSLFGPLAKHFIFVSILFHFCCSILLLIVSKRLGLNSRASFLSALMYLTLFAHFHAYMWPMAFQHLIVVFFILLGLNLYLKTDRLISDGSNYHLFFILTLLINFVASFCRLSILILPAMTIIHILFCSKDDEDRIRKYDIWLPLFVIYSIYPLFTLVVGDPRLKALFRPLIPLTALVTKNPTLHMFVYKINIPIKFSILFLLGLSCLFVFRVMLVIYQRYDLKRVLKWALITMAIMVMVLLVSLGGPKRLLVPYNIIVPFVGIFASFLQPLQNALLIDSARPYHFIPLQLTIFNFLLSSFMLGLFIKNFVFKHKQLVVLAIWYAINMVYLYLWNPITSRYLIYLSPLFCIIFSAVFDYSYTYLTRPIRFKIIAKEVIPILIFISICIPNLLAIKLSMFMGKMVNTFSIYDYIRAADEIKQDLINKNSIKDIRRKEIYINNIIPIVFTQAGDFSASDPYNDNLRFIFMQVFNDTSINIKLNQTPQKETESYIIYSLDGYRINNKDGVNISLFSQFFEGAMEQLRLNQYMDARDLLSKAIEERPHLFNYLLPNLKLEDLEWITNGSAMRIWIDKIEYFYTFGRISRKVERAKYISTIMDREIDEYIQCLFYMSFLKYVSGDAEESKYWFSKIRFLEDDYRRLYSWLSQVPLIKSDKRLLSFLDNFNDASLYLPPNNYIDRYKFEKFLFKLIFKI